MDQLSSLSFGITSHGHDMRCQDQIRSLDAAKLKSAVEALMQ